MIKPQGISFAWIVQKTLDLIIILVSLLIKRVLIIVLLSQLIFQLTYVANVMKVGIYQKQIHAAKLLL